MDFSTIIKFLPYIMQAVSLSKEIAASVKSNASVTSILEKHSQPVVDLVTKAGAELFPNLTTTQQVQAGATRFDMTTAKRIQTQLVALGAKLDVDGYYGNATKTAVKAFQSSHGLDADGWVGPLTQAALDKATGSRG